MIGVVGMKGSVEIAGSRVNNASDPGVLPFRTANLLRTDYNIAPRTVMAVNLA